MKWCIYVCKGSCKNCRASRTHFGNLNIHLIFDMSTYTIHVTFIYTPFPHLIIAILTASLSNSHVLDPLRDTRVINTRSRRGKLFSPSRECGILWWMCPPPPHTHTPNVFTLPANSNDAGVSFWSHLQFSSAWSSWHSFLVLSKESRTILLTRFSCVISWQIIHRDQFTFIFKQLKAIVTINGNTRRVVIFVGRNVL